MERASGNREALLELLRTRAGRDPQAAERALDFMFESAGARGKLKIGQVAVCWAETYEEARRTVREWWPNTALTGASPPS